MKKKHEPPPQDALHQYQKERHADFIARSTRLDELAFKTSERYDHWVLTLSGGALAISLTFIEKIAPSPAPWTLWVLGASWLSFIVAILAGFFAIHFSRKAIYRERDIAQKVYEVFISTSTATNMLGEKPSPEENLPIKWVGISNEVSKWCLAGGTGLLCFFALVNLTTAKPHQGVDKLSLPTESICCITNAMSKDTNPPPLQGVTPPTPDGSLQGIHVGDPASGVKGSYQPVRQQDTPPPPPPPPAKK